MSVRHAVSQELQYQGYFEKVNAKPPGDYILIFASDWHKDYWAFYAYISKECWKKDIFQINNLIKRMNWRDGDVYVELIDYHDDTMRDFYMYLYDLSDMGHWSVLDSREWQRRCP